MPHRIFPLLLLLLLLLAGCGSSEALPATYPDADTVAQNICALQEISMESLDPDSTRIWLEELYQLPESLWSEASIYQASHPGSAAEVAVIRLSDPQHRPEAVARLEAYQLARLGDFTGYDPQQAALVEDGLVSYGADGHYVALLLCPQPHQAANSFFSALGQPLPSFAPSPGSAPASGSTPSFSPAPAPTPTPELSSTPTPLPTAFLSQRTPFHSPGQDDMSQYDTSAILTAWQTGDESSLSDKDRRILHRCREIITQYIRDDMSEWEREWAIYAWLTSSVDYDQTHYQPFLPTPRTSYEPYGPLMEGVGICLGYASTFQLLMDLLDVECITVIGAAFQSREDHAWNMVRLGGNWYCVDATWDNRSGGHLERCRYFNVTSQYMADTDHQWDYFSVPEATVADGGTARP